jgi:hypothetical protein
LIAGGQRGSLITWYMLARTHSVHVNTDSNAHASAGMESGNAEHKFRLLSGLFAALDKGTYSCNCRYTFSSKCKLI